MSTFRESSKKDWLGSTREDINCGSLQRIADACEKMAASYESLRAERDRLKDICDCLRGRNKKLERRIAGLRGYIKRMKEKGGAS